MLYNYRNELMLYGISERAIKDVVLKKLDDMDLFEKIQDSIYSYVNDEFIKKILDGIDPENIDGIKEISEWIKNHQDLYNELKDSVDKKVTGVQTEFSNSLENLKITILGEGVKDTYDTLVEIGTWIENHGTEVQSLYESIIGIQGDINETNKTIDDYKTTLNDIQSTINDYQINVDLKLKDVQNKFNEVENEHVMDVDKKLKDIQDKFNTLLLQSYSSRASYVINEGGNIPPLNEDVKITNKEDIININKDTTLNLNGHELFVSSELTTYGDVLPINGSNVVINNGKIYGDSQNSSSGVILVKNDSNVTLNNVEVVGVNPIYIYSTKGKSEVEINDGCTLTSEGTQVVYVEKQQNGGKVIINGGYFESKNTNPTYIDKNGNQKFLLNLKDNIRQPTTDKKPIDFIEVLGGTFVNFDPSDNSSEGEHTTYVPEGYISIMRKSNGNRLYTVSIDDSKDVVTKIKTGEKITLEHNLKPSESTNLFLGVNSDVDLNGHIIAAKGDSNKATVTITNTAEVKLSNGYIISSDIESNEGNTKPIIFIKSNGGLELNNITIDGEGIPVWINGDGNAHVTINSGVYSSEDSHTLYVQKGGKIIVNGGTFGKPGVVNDFLINIYDSTRKGHDNRDFIEIFGGEFWNFDPSDNISEGIPTNYVNDNYTVVVEEYGDDKLYKVIQK